MISLPAIRISHFPCAVILTVWVVFFVWLFSGCARAPETRTPAPHFHRSAGSIIVPEDSPLYGRLSYVEARESVISEERTYPGVLEPLPGRFVRVFPPAPGRVAEVHVRLGQTVEAGQALVSLHSPEFVSAQGEFLKARSALFVAQRNLERSRTLHTGRVAAQRELDEAESEVEMALADLAAARDMLLLFGGDPEALASGGVLTVRSPLSGRISALQAAVGELYREDEEEPLAVVSDLEKVWLSISVPERDAPFLRPGAGVQARFSAFPGQMFSGEVAVVADTVDPETRSVRVRVELENPERDLKPGMFGTVRVRGMPSRQITVPETAVLVSGGDSFVFEKTGPGTLRPRRVTTGQSQDGMLVIRSGLEAGAVVLVRDGVLFL